MNEKRTSEVGAQAVRMPARVSFTTHIQLQNSLSKHIPGRLHITNQEHQASCPPFEGCRTAADVEVCTDVVVVHEDLLGCGRA